MTRNLNRRRVHNRPTAPRHRRRRAVPRHQRLPRRQRRHTRRRHIARPNRRITNNQTISLTRLTHRRLVRTRGRHQTRQRRCHQNRRFTTKISSSRRTSGPTSRHSPLTANSIFLRRQRQRHDRRSQHGGISHHNFNRQSVRRTNNRGRANTRRTRHPHRLRR